jgi:hypothetical protein
MLLHQIVQVNDEYFHQAKSNKIKISFFKLNSNRTCVQ